MALWAESVANLKVWLGTTATTDDTLLSDLLTAIQGDFETYCGRLFPLGAAVTELYDGGMKEIHLKRWPVVSITTVKEASDWTFSTATALTSDTDYHLLADRGIIVRVGGSWVSGRESVQVVYKGGYVAVGTTVGSGETALPDDLRYAAKVQAEHVYRHKEQFGLNSVGVSGQSISLAPSSLLPPVKDVLERYRSYWL